MTTAKWCEDCGAMMQLRKNTFGQFWACVRFPDCAGVANIPRVTGRRKPTTSRMRFDPTPLTWDNFQQNLISHRRGTVLALAGAGSGKSTVGVEWLSNLLMFDGDMSTILGLVYGRDAGHDLRSKLCARLQLPAPTHPDDLMVVGGHSDRTTAMICDRTPTIHSWAWTQIKSVKKHKKLRMVGKKGAPTLYAIAKEALEKNAPFEPLEVIELYGLCTEALVEFNAKTMQEHAMREGIVVPERMVEALVKVRKRIEKEDLITYPDMLRIVCDYIETGGWPATGFEPNLKWLFVDEVQDSNMARVRIIEFLAKRARAAIFCGDLRQSIYSFAGARPDVVRAMVPEKDWLLLPVTRRCPTAVVDLANRFCDGKPWNVGGKTIAAPRAEVGRVEKVLDDQWRKELAKRINQQIGNHPDGLRAHNKDQVAVIGRTRRELALVECALLGAKLPVRWLGDGQGPWLTAWGKAFRGYLALIHEQVTTSELVAEAFQKPKRNLGAATVASVLKVTSGKTDSMFWTLLDQADPLQAESMKKVVRRLQSVSYAEQVKAITDILMECATRGRDVLSRQAQERVEIVEALGASALELGSASAVEHAVLSGALLKVDDPAVVLSTVHRAKGLEWTHVHGAAVDQRNFPHYKATDLEEEQRIYYVLITRARRTLTLYAAGAFSAYVEPDGRSADVAAQVGDGHAGRG